MDQGVGIACGGCHTLNPTEAGFCVGCGAALVLFFRTGAAALPSAEGIASAVQSVSPTASGSEPTEEELMDQARNYICRQCSTPVPSGHKFCGACGATVPEAIQDMQTKYFGAMQTPGKARLILIRGDQGVDGLSYLLQGKEHIAGRRDAQILFPEDPWLSDRHANFLYQDDTLVVRDEGSTNGVYVRVQDTTEIQPGAQFLCGEQVFLLEETPQDSSGPDPDQTYFYSSPKRPSPFRVVQILRGGAEGMVHCAREDAVSVGRENVDMNFPEDVYMSGHHATVEKTSSGYVLKDSGSKNGTYIRIEGQHPLADGDYVFLGKQLLRVEMTA